MKKYFKHKINNLLIINGIVTVHYFEFDKNYRNEGESHDFWELVYCDKQDVFCYADGKQIHLKEGQAFFHKPNEFHSLSANGKTAPNVFIISFVCHSEAMRFFEGKKITLSDLQKKYIYTIIDEAKRSFNIPFSDPELKKMEILSSPILGGVQMIKNYLEILLINLMRSTTENDGENSLFVNTIELGGQLVKKTVEMLKDNVYGMVSIQDICNSTIYSRAYLFKKFKKTTGKTVMEYFINLKMTEAKRLIRERELSVKEIADKLAFDTPNYFSKTFKKKTGMTPLQYRKRSSL